MTQLILLSGGSGKRLWPLSNDARSKQFLPLLLSPEGRMESMIQRVVRQMHGSGLECEITVATNLTQKDEILGQLGDNVSIVTEPQRRDTFPAIALSSSFLSLSKGCSRDEVVVVMPCDPYTQEGYFKTISRMVECVKADIAELVLMGIKPDCPSSKFGYVVPQGPASTAVEGVKMVRRFTEKPDTATAAQLLEEGAYWNGGVFAYRLGYLMDIVSKYIKVSAFDELHSRYGELPKISFDYEVAEKAKSVAVVEYNGAWKDLGTWNALCEELPSPVLGNALLGQSAHNTHIVNELPIPVFCDGVDNAIVAASPDGILVAAKEVSEGIKKSVESLVDRPMFEERSWGKYTVISRGESADGFKTLTKDVEVKAGRNIGLQSHSHRDENWVVVDGEGQLELGGESRTVVRGDSVRIRRGEKHDLKAKTDLHLIEVQTGESVEESDVEYFGC